LTHGKYNPKQLSKLAIHKFPVQLQQALHLASCLKLQQVSLTQDALQYYRQLHTILAGRKLEQIEFKDGRALGNQLTNRLIAALNKSYRITHEPTSALKFNLRIAVLDVHTTRQLQQLLALPVANLIVAANVLPQLLDAMHLQVNPYLIELGLPSCSSPFQPQDIHNIADAFTNLQRLNLNNNTLSAETLSVIGILPLTSLEIGGARITNDKLVRFISAAKYPHKLITLSLALNRDLNDGAAKLIVHFSNLKHLNLAKTAISDTTIMALVAANLPLANLILTETRISSQALVHLASLNSLRKINLAKIAKLAEKEVKQFYLENNLSKLEYRDPFLLINFATIFNVLK
jgi:hypothetical protein